MILNPNDVFAGRYVLQELLGKGGFSVVWKASDNMADDTIVAIKIYAPDKGLDNQGIKQFSREYSLVQSLHHTRLLTARHFDVYEGSPYLVVPFCSKGSVGHMLADKGTLSEKEIAGIIYQVCDGLAYLHTREIIHQDIKPDNVLINDEGDYLLTDFGISSRVRSTLRKSTGSSLSMTVAYAAPERFASVPTIVPAGDVFAVGVMIYELATGDVPWMGQGGMAVQQNVTLPELPSSFSKELSGWMQASMLKDPEARPTAKQLAEAAQQYVRSGQWLAAPKSASAEPAAPARQYRARETQKMEDIQFFQEQKAAETSAPTPTPAPQKKTSGTPTMAVGQGGAAIGAKKKTPVWLYVLIPVVLGGIGYGVWAMMQDKKEEQANVPAKKDSTVITAGKTEVIPVKKDTATTASATTAATTPVVATATPDAGNKTFVPEVVYVKGGSFTMGNKNGHTDEQEEHNVSLRAFNISRTEVTADQYAAFCKAVGKPYSASGAKPATKVSWNDAVAYCKWLSKETGSTWALPTEAQWEFVAKKSLAGGMTNGVNEWCNDWYDEMYYQYSSADNPTGPSKGGSKVVRGGSTSDRDFYAPTYKEGALSFRVVKR